MVKDQYPNSENGYKNPGSSSHHNNEFYVNKSKHKRKSSAFAKPAIDIDNSVSEEHSGWGKKRKNCDSNRFHVTKRSKQENSFENVVRKNLKMEESNDRFRPEKRQDNELFFFDIAGTRGNSYVESHMLDKISTKTATPGISNTKNINNVHEKKELYKKSSSFKMKLKKKHTHGETFINDEEKVISLSDSSYKNKKKKRNKRHETEVTNHQGSCGQGFIDFSEDSSLLNISMENFYKDLNNVKESIQAEEEKKLLKIKKHKVDGDNKPKKKSKNKHLCKEILVDIRDSDCEVTTFHQCIPRQRKKKKTKMYHTENGTEFDVTLCENGESRLERNKSGNNSTSTEKDSQLLDNNCDIVGVSEHFVPRKKKKKKHLHAEIDNSSLKKRHRVSSENTILCNIDMLHKTSNPDSNSQKGGLMHIKDSECEVSNVNESSLFKNQKKKKKKNVIIEHKTGETNSPQREQSTLSQTGSLIDRLLEIWDNESDLIEINEESRNLKKQNSELSKSVEDRNCEAVEASDSPSSRKKKKKRHKEDKSSAIDNFSENINDSESEAVKKKKKKKANESDTTIENTKRGDATSLESVHIDSGLDIVISIGDSSSLNKKKKRQENTSNESISERKREILESGSGTQLIVDNIESVSSGATSVNVSFSITKRKKKKADLSECKDDNNASLSVVDDTKNVCSGAASVSDSSFTKKKKKKKGKPTEINTERSSKNSSICKNSIDDTQAIIDFIEDDSKAVNIIESLVKKKKKKKKRQEENSSSETNTENTSNSEHSKYADKNNDTQIVDDNSKIICNSDSAFLKNEKKKEKKKKHHENDLLALEGTPKEEFERQNRNSSACNDSHDIQLITNDIEGVDKAVDVTDSAFKKKKRQQKNASVEAETEDTSKGDRETLVSSKFPSGKGNSSVSKNSNNDTRVIIDSVEDDNSAANISDTLPKKKKKKKRQQEGTSSEINTETNIDVDSKAVCNSDSAFLKTKKKKKMKHSEDDSADISLDKTQTKEFETSLESTDIIDSSIETSSKFKEKTSERLSKRKQQNSELPDTNEYIDYKAETSDSSLTKKKKKKKREGDDYLADNEDTPKKGDETLEASVDNLGRYRDENDEQGRESCLDIKDSDCNAERISNFALSKSKKNREEIGNGPSTGYQDFSGCSKWPYTSSPTNNDEKSVISNALETTTEKALKSENRNEISMAIADTESDLNNKKKKKRKDQTHQFEISTEEKTSVNCNSMLDTIERKTDYVKRPSCVLLKYDSESTTSKNIYYHEVYASSSEGYISESSEIMSPSKQLKKKRRSRDSRVDITKSDCDNTSETLNSITALKTGLETDKEIGGGGEQSGRSEGQVVENDFSKIDIDENSSQLDGILQETKADCANAGIAEKGTTFRQKSRKLGGKVSSEDFENESDDESHIMGGRSSISSGRKNVEDDKEKFQQIDIVLKFALPPLHSILTRSTLPTKEQLKEIKERNIEVKHGPFTKEEDEKILANWKKFCKEYELPMVPSIFVSLPRKMPMVQKNNFLRYLSRGLNNRFLNRVHARFKILVQKDHIKAGRFAPEEDDTILMHMNESSSNFPFRDLAELLSRSAISVEKRYIRLSAENKNLVNWTPKLVDKLVKYMKRITKCEDVEELKHKKLNAKVWNKLSRKMENIPALKLERAWSNTIYPRLYADSDVSLKQIKIRILEMIDDMNETDWRKIRWKEIAEEFPGFTHLKIYMMFKQLVNFHVPKEKHGNLKVCVKFLRDKIRNCSVASKPGRFKRFVYKDGHIIGVKKRSDSPTV